MANGWLLWHVNSMRTQKRFSRRRFLGCSASAVAAGFPTLAPTKILGKGDKTSPSEKITLGCIGVGRMGTGNMQNFLSLPGCRVVAVCDAYREHREKAKKLVDTEYGDTGCAMTGTSGNCWRATTSMPS